jgi:hypothetical protein
VRAHELKAAEAVLLAERPTARVADLPPGVEMTPSSMRARVQRTSTAAVGAERSLPPEAFEQAP